MNSIKDGKDVHVLVEEERGASGALWTAALRAALPKGHVLRTIKPMTSKARRASAFAVAVGNRKVKIVEGQWNGWFLRELAAFPERNVHDDAVDACVYAYNELARPALKFESWVR